MKLNLYKLARQLRQACASAARIENSDREVQGYQQVLDEIRGLVAKRKRDNGNEEYMTTNEVSAAARRRLH